VSDGLAPRFGTESLRYGLLAVTFAHLGGAALSLLAARTLRSELAAARAA